ncbi:MAG: FAD/NAD(P)-binding protein [Candidatus Nanoarchaeia archaeon]
MDRLIPTKYRIIDYIRETDDNFMIKVDMAVKHCVGQFVQVSVPGLGECPISICSDSEKYLELNIREVGNVTNALARLKKGDSIFIRGPYGKGYPMHGLEGNNLILVGGGCGVAPLRGAIDYISHNRDKYKDVKLFLGYRSANDILFGKDIERWEKEYDLNISFDKEEGNLCYDAKVGFVTNSVEAAVTSNKNTAAFICGPPMMMEKTIEILKSKGFNDDQIFISAERLMYCGIGVCCHCMIRGKFTCKDGPVFRYDMISQYKND